MKEIKAKFINGKTCVYTEFAKAALVTDPEVVMIYDNETGEVIYTNELYRNFMRNYFNAFRRLETYLFPPEVKERMNKELESKIQKLVTEFLAEV